MYGSSLSPGSFYPNLAATAGFPRVISSPLGSSVSPMTPTYPPRLGQSLVKDSKCSKKSLAKCIITKTTNFIGARLRVLQHVCFDVGCHDLSLVLRHSSPNIRWYGRRWVADK
uniref:Ovule protein n=1 Tax=Heterorhabditis bacteriophora TaxID=37862 RepID=A0A1I7X961_HETBA